MKIALVSLDQNWEDKNGNKERVLASLEKLTPMAVDWVIFPEMTLTGFTMNASMHAEEYDKSNTIAFFSQCAQCYNTYIVFGLIVRGEVKATNNLIVISPDGKVQASYAKIHPFSYARENEYYEQGKRVVTTVMNDIPVGVSICYDLRFPELFQALSKSVKLIINIANWPEKRIEHWNTLLKSRAIENQVYFVGVNRTGVDGNGLIYPYSSMVINAEGTRCKPLDSNGEVDIYDIDINSVDWYRKEFPVKLDRQNDLYRMIL